MQQSIPCKVAHCNSDTSSWFVFQFFEQCTEYIFAGFYVSGGDALQHQQDLFSGTKLSVFQLVLFSFFFLFCFFLLLSCFWRLRTSYVSVASRDFSGLAKYNFAKIAWNRLRDIPSLIAWFPSDFLVDQYICIAGTLL